VNSTPDNASIHVFISGDAHLLKDATKQLEERIRNNKQSFIREEFVMGEKPMLELIHRAQTVPLFAPMQLIYVHAIHKIKADEASALLGYLENPSPKTMLCLCGDKIDQRTKFGQWLVKQKLIKKLDPPKGQQLFLWLRDRAKKLGYQMDNVAAQSLVDFVGDDSGLLATEIEKLCTFAGDEKLITTEHIAAVVPATREASIFVLTEAFGQRQLTRALNTLGTMLDDRDNGLAILAMIVRQVRLLLQAQSLTADTHDAQAAQILGVPPFVVSGIKKQAHNYTRAELQQILQKIQNVDILMKSSRLSHRLQLEHLLVESMAKVLKETA